MIFLGESVISELGSALLPMAGFAFATSASPGPVNIVSAMSGARFGAMRSIPYVLGATVGFIAILLLVGAGLGLFITRHPLVAKLLAIAGALYMLHLAYRIARASTDHMLDGEVAAPPNLMAGVIAQVINPKAWIVSLSAISI
ncbi:MAG: LysE family transporter, partial [Rhodocyclaceae bacterium]|nr:LysE family transporter [Rhodocyclaceae bacterium]